MKNKLFLVTAWIFAVFGGLWLLNFAYDMNKSYFLFVFIIIFGSMAYDVLKSIIRYNPLYQSDLATVSRYVLYCIFVMVAAFTFIILAGKLFGWGLINIFVRDLISTIGLLLSIIIGTHFLSKAEKHFKMSDRA